MVFKCIYNNMTDSWCDWFSSSGFLHAEKLICILLLNGVQQPTVALYGQCDTEIRAPSQISFGDFVKKSYEIVKSCIYGF